MAARKSPLIVIVGETASGKSALAMQLADKFDGEIICADSRTVYKYMDIGTAKPSHEERQRIRHHLLDVANPDEVFTAAQFKELAQQAVTDISAKGKLPTIVGGTGLYIDGLLFDFGFEKRADKKALRPDTLVLGCKIDRDRLKKRIHQRVRRMMDAGLETEVRDLVGAYGWQASAMTGIGYREFRPYFAGLQDIKETVQNIEKNTNLYAKRQRTWFKRNDSIHWLDDPSQAVDLVTTFLNTKQ